MAEGRDIKLIPWTTKPFKRGFVSESFQWQILHEILSTIVIKQTLG